MQRGRDADRGHQKKEPTVVLVDNFSGNWVFGWDNPDVANLLGLRLVAIINQIEIEPMTANLRAHRRCAN
jgi:hypothetical protein